MFPPQHQSNTFFIQMLQISDPGGGDHSTLLVVAWPCSSSFPHDSNSSTGSSVASPYSLLAHLSAEWHFPWCPLDMLETLISLGNVDEQLVWVIPVEEKSLMLVEMALICFFSKCTLSWYLKLCSNLLLLSSIHCTIYYQSTQFGFQVLSWLCFSTVKPMILLTSL